MHLRLVIFLVGVWVREGERRTVASSMKCGGGGVLFGELGSSGSSSGLSSSSSPSCL